MRWALVLSGGGGNGIAHIGVLKELERLQLRPDLIVGTSMGAIVGGVYATGKSAAWMENYITTKFNIKDMASTRALKWGEGPVVKIMLAGAALHNLHVKRGVESAEKILELLREVTQNINIEDTIIPYACNAVDLLNGKEKVFTQGNLAEAIRCSMAIPPFFEPYELDDGLYIDGCFTDNRPIHIAREMGYKKILSVNVVPVRPLEKSDLKNGYDILFRAVSIALSETPETHKATVSLTAYKGAYNFDFNHIEELITVGQQAVRDNETRIKKKFTSWYQ